MSLKRSMKHRLSTVICEWESARHKLQIQELLRGDSTEPSHKIMFWNVTFFGIVSARFTSPALKALTEPFASVWIKIGRLHPVFPFLVVFFSAKLWVEQQMPSTGVKS